MRCPHIDSETLHCLEHY